MSWEVEFTSATRAVAKDGAVLYLFEPCQALAGGLIFAPDGTVKRIPGEGGEVRSVLLEVARHVDLVASFCGARGGCTAVEQVEFPSICVDGGVCATAIGGRVHVLTRDRYLGAAPQVSLDGPHAEALLAAVDELQKYIEERKRRGEPAETPLLRLGELARPKIAEVYV